MKNVIVFGNVPLATWAVKKILESGNFNLLGVVCDKYDANHFANHGMAEESLYSFSKINELNILSFEEAYNEALNNDVLGISIRYNRLFKKDYFEKFKFGIINLHGGELPRYRGANIANYTVLEDSERVGGTMHFISDGIDEGDIVERVLLPIKNKPTAYDVFQLSLLALKEAFLRFIERIDVVSSDLPIHSIPQKTFVLKGEQSQLYYKKNIEKFRIIEFSDNLEWDDLFRKARAHTFPGHQGLILKNGSEYLEVRALNNDDLYK